MHLPPRSALTPLALSLMLALAGCSDDAAAPDTPPELPPLASMQVDLSFFSASGAAQAPPLASAPKLHFFNAGLRVLVINTATIVVMSVPVATFGAALQRTPQFEDGRWNWEYTLTHQGSSFTAHLAGFGQGSRTLWEMRITAPGHQPPLEEFLWYEGDAAVGNESGTWHVYDAVGGDPGLEVLRIDWTHVADDDATLVFTATNPGIPENGDTLTFDADGQARSITYFDASAGTTATIWWDATTGEGWIEAPDYNDGERSCWDASQEDRACP